MQGYFTPKQLSEMLGGGESTWRWRAANGRYKNAFQAGDKGTWYIPLSDINQTGRDYDEMCAEPAPLDPRYPKDPSSIVLARNADQRYGIYINQHWYGAGQALVMLNYLRQHEQWLIDGAKENEATATIDGSHEIGSVIEYKGEQWIVLASDRHNACLYRVGDKAQAFAFLSEFVRSEQAHFQVSPPAAVFHDDGQVILLRNAAYSSDIGFYDSSLIKSEERTNR